MIKDILFIISFSIVFASHFEPLERLKTRLGLNRGGKTISLYKSINLIIYCLKYVLNCSPCFSFWFSLILLQDIKLSFIIYILTYVISKEINKVNL